MAKVHSLILTKQDGQVSFDRDPASVWAMLANGVYKVTVTKKGEPRSLDQNALMWLWFSCIEAETGTTKQDVHDYYCSKFLRRQITWNGTVRTVVDGTSSLTKMKMKSFLDQVQADAAAELGITLPLPEDRYFEEFYQTYR